MPAEEELLQGLLQAVQQRNLLQLRSLLGQGFDLNSSPPPGASPLLIEAACEGQPEIVDLLLDHHASLAVQDTTYGEHAGL